MKHTLFPTVNRKRPMYGLGTPVISLKEYDEKMNIVEQMIDDVIKSFANIIGENKEAPPPEFLETQSFQNCQ